MGGLSERDQSRLDSHLNSVLIGEGPGGNFSWSVAWGVVKRSVVGPVGRTYGAKLRGSEADTEASE